MVGLKVGPIFYGIGTGNFLYCFFSNIAHHLENGKWGSVYPVLMDTLYNGELSCKDSENAIMELQEIKEKFKLITPDKAIWEIENIGKKPVFAQNLSDKVTDLSNYFYTSDGRNLLEVILKSLETAIKVKKNISIRSI